MIMKNILYIIVFALLFIACEKEQIQVFNSQRFVQFSTNYQDTIYTSFFFHNDAPTIKIPVELELVGNALKEDTKFEITAIAEETDVPSESYDILNLIFRKDVFEHNLEVQFNNNPLFKTKKYKLTLEIGSNENIKKGQTAFSRKTLVISDMIEKPVWWDTNMDNYYLGLFYPEKYKAFMNITGVMDLSDYDCDELINISLKFKNELKRLKEAGAPLLLDDGTDMLSTVKILG